MREKSINKIKVKILYLAHVRRASATRAAMRGFSELMVRRDSQCVLFIDESWVRVYLREVFTNPKMVNDVFDEEHVRVAHYPKLTPGKNQTRKCRIRNGGFCLSLDIF